jgi:hypothetical protein
MSRKNVFELPKDVEKFVKRPIDEDLKKFLKKNKDYYDKKKDCKKAYYAVLTDLLPEVLHVLTKYGYREEVQKIKNDAYEKLIDIEYLKYLTKVVKKGEEEIQNIELFPIVANDIIREIEAQYKKQLEANPDASKPDLSDIVLLSRLILEKKIKKCVKKGIDELIAFDLLSIIPCKECMKDRQPMYRTRLFMEKLYAHAATKQIELEPIVKYIYKEDFASNLIGFMLMERKDKTKNFNDLQKKFFIDSNEWLFNTLEEYDEESIRKILEAYLVMRKEDEKNGKDSERRYHINSLPDKDYPRIKKVVTLLIKKDENNTKFF